MWIWTYNTYTSWSLNSVSWNLDLVTGNCVTELRLALSLKFLIKKESSVTFGNTSWINFIHFWLKHYSSWLLQKGHNQRVGTLEDFNVLAMWRFHYRDILIWSTLTQSGILCFGQDVAGSKFAITLKFHLLIWITGLKDSHVRFVLGDILFWTPFLV